MELRILFFGHYPLNRLKFEIFFRFETIYPYMFFNIKLC